MGVAAVLGLAAEGAEGATARGAKGLRVEIRADASALVLDEGSSAPRGQTLCEIALELAPLARARDGPKARILPPFGRGPVRVVLGDRTLLVSAEAREIAGGILIDFRARPARRAGADAPWYEPLEIRAGVVARFSGPVLRGARGFLAGRYVAIETQRPVGPGPTAEPWEPGKPGEPKERKGPEEKKRLSAKAWGRGLRLAFERGAELVIEGELPGQIKLNESPEGDFVLRLAATEADTSTPVAFAVFVGRWAYEGRPVLLDEPRVTFLEDLRCFEVIVRAFGRWRDPFDPDDATVEAAWRAGTTQGTKVPGFYGRDFRAVIEEADDGTTHERLAPAGWPRFRSRLPVAASGGQAVVAFVTKSGSASAEVTVPAGRLWPDRAEAPGDRAPSGVTLDAAAWRSTADAARAIFELHSAHLRAARLPVYEGAYALEADVPGETDLAAAWRLDRAFEEARKCAVRLIPVLDRGEPPDEFRRSSPYFNRAVPLARSVRDFFAEAAPRAAFARKLRYAAARWGGLAALGGWEVFDGPDLVSGESETAALVEWLGEMAGVLRDSDPDHTVSVTLRAEATAKGPARAAFDGLRSRLLVGRAVELWASEPLAAKAAFRAARSASERADYLVLDVPAESTSFTAENAERRNGDGRVVPAGDPRGASFSARSATSAVKDSRRSTHAALWSAVVGARRRVFLGAGLAAQERTGAFTNGAGALARFLSDGSSSGEFADAFSFESAVCRIVGSRGPAGAVWWIVRVRGEGPGPRSPRPEPEDGEEREPEMLPVVRDVEFEIGSLRPGRYRIEWWQPHEGALLTTVEVRARPVASQASRGVVTVRVPPFASDLAGRLARIADDAPSAFGK